jgi:hypothetical protein
MKGYLSVEVRTSKEKDEKCNQGGPRRVALVDQEREACRKKSPGHVWECEEEEIAASEGIDRLGKSR